MHHMNQRTRCHLERAMGLRGPEHNKPVRRNEEAVATDDCINTAMFQNAQLDFIVPVQAIDRGLQATGR